MEYDSSYNTMIKTDLHDLLRQNTEPYIFQLTNTISFSNFDQVQDIPEGCLQSAYAA